MSTKDNYALHLESDDQDLATRTKRILFAPIKSIHIIADIEQYLSQEQLAVNLLRYYKWEKIDPALTAESVEHLQ